MVWRRNTVTSTNAWFVAAKKTFRSALGAGCWERVISHRQAGKPFESSKTCSINLARPILLVRIQSCKLALKPPPGASHDAHHLL